MLRNRIVLIATVIIGVLLHLSSIKPVYASYDYTWFNQKVNELKNEYYEGRSWSNSNSYPSGWGGCWAFANIMADSIFGYPTPRNSWTITDKDSIVPGDIIRTSGHTMFIIGVEGDTLILAEGNYGYSNPHIHWGREMNKYDESFTVYHSPNYDSVISAYNPEIRGEYMQNGYDRVLPDGDYIIACAADVNYYLDISGGDYPAQEGTNVNLWYSDGLNIASPDAWTIRYENGFYRISQYGTSMSLDVAGADTLQEKNVQIWTANSSSAQQWAISQNGRNGYRIEARCSGFSLDVAGGTNAFAGGTNVQQWADNDSGAQDWIFIPYKPSQTLADGRYILISELDSNLELDVSGDTGDIEDGRNVQIWTDNAPSQYNSFDITALSDGYYKVIHAASGKALDLAGGGTALYQNIQVWAPNTSSAQKWAITPDGYNGGYVLRVRSSGMAMDVKKGSTENGTNVEQYPYHGGQNQTWRFVPAEHIVSYDANGGMGAPVEQTKYYKGDLTLSSDQPMRDGYKFIGWGSSADSEKVIYRPEDTYSKDVDITLYAIWERVVNIISYNTNGGDDTFTAQTKLPDETVILSSDIPTRLGYTFLGWATNPDAAIPEYQPGDHYSADSDLTLYAVWEITNPPTLTGADSSMLVGDSRDWRDFVTLSHDGVLNYTLRATAEGNAIRIDGAQISALSTGTATITVYAEEYPQAACTINVNVVDLSNRMTLPSGLEAIEKEAFENSGINSVIIPAGCTSIGSSAFANNRGLVFVWIPTSVQTIGTNAFSGCPGLTIYCYEGSVAHTYATSNHIPYVILSDGWVLAEDLPLGATVSDEKWTYTKSTKETTTSTASTMDGWIQDGFTWQQTGTGTHIYGNFPGGFDTNNYFYQTYAKPSMSNSASGNTKREVGGSSHHTYVYWHWCWTDWVDDENRNILINDWYGEDGGKNYIYFDAFETTTSLSQEGMTNNGLRSYDGLYSTYHHPEYNLAGYASWWWYRIDIQKQTYTDYQKLFNYVKVTTEECESSTTVAESEDITNVQHWVRYGF